MVDQDSQTHAELASFGEELRREREIRGISLKEIADATKISKRFLEAVERNDHQNLPAPVFTRGFVREYARYVGLNADEMVNRYNYAAAGDDRVEQSAHLDRLVNAPPREPVRKRGIPSAYARVDGNVYLLLAIVAALIVVTYFALRYRKETAEARQTEAATAVVQATKPSPVPTPAPAQPAVAPPAPLRLTLELTESSWIALEVDGKTVVNDELRRGERRSFDASESFRFKTIGNAGGVLLTLNELRVPPMGREGQVIHDRLFDRAFLDTLAPAQGRSST